MSNGIPDRDGFFNLGDERGILRTSIAAVLVIALLGVGFGLVSGSHSIAFDGVYSLVDASMSLLSLGVVNLITAHARTTARSKKLRERFLMGFWHLEPMVLALNGTLLMGIVAYALVTAVMSLFEGGRSLEFGYAMVYAFATLLACAAFAVLETRANRGVGSEFVRLDIKGWIMSGGISAALLAAFCIGRAVQGTRLQWIAPYMDPAVLALICLLILPLPVSTIRQALADVFLVTPLDLKLHVDEVARHFVAQCGFVAHRAYVARVGRLQQIELYFIVPPDMPARTIAQWDALRDEIGHAIGSEGPDRWLTIAFTGDLEWAE